MNKAIQATEFAHTVFKAEGERQTKLLSADPCRVVSIKEVLDQLAEKLNKKHKFIK